jgi:hypothetical protein
VNEAERFKAKVNINTQTGCWEWTAAKGTNGYPMFWFGGKMGRAHRWAYAHWKGDIPDGMHLDHLCRVRHCVNPDHLEAVTASENMLRSPLVGRYKRNLPDNCPHGHPYAGDNLYVDPRGHRECRTCRRQALARHNNRKKEQK